MSREDKGRPRRSRECSFRALVGSRQIFYCSSAVSPLATALRLEIDSCSWTAVELQLDCSLPRALSVELQGNEPCSHLSQRIAARTRSAVRFRDNPATCRLRECCDRWIDGVRDTGDQDRQGDCHHVAPLWRHGALSWRPKRIDDIISQLVRISGQIRRVGSREGPVEGYEQESPECANLLARLRNRGPKKREGFGVLSRRLSPIITSPGKIASTTDYWLINWLRDRAHDMTLQSISIIVSTCRFT
jgi:hypothetical protein